MGWEEWQPGSYEWVPDGDDCAWLDADPDPQPSDEQLQSSQYRVVHSSPVQESTTSAVVFPNSHIPMVPFDFAAFQSVAPARASAGQGVPMFVAAAPAPTISDATDQAVRDTAEAIMETRPYQQAQNRLTNWFKRWEAKHVDHKKKKWNDLELKEKQKYTRSFLKTNFYKNLKGDVKETQSTYCYMILRGEVTTAGRPGVTGASRKRAATVEPEATVEVAVATFTGCAFMLTLYPELVLSADEYGCKVYDDIDTACAAVLRNPAMTLLILKAEAWLEAEVVQGDQHFRVTLKGELCPEKWKTGTVKLHLHIQIHKQTLQNFTMTGALKFDGKAIYIRRCHVDRRTAQLTIERGHYYLAMPKPGSLFLRGNFTAGEHYGIRAQWVTYYLSKGQLTFDAAEGEYCRCVGDAMRNVQNLKFLVDAASDSNLQKQRTAMEIRLQRIMKTPKVVPEFVSWMKSMGWELVPDVELKGRFQFIVFNGPPNTGKSQFVRMQYPVGALLELDCGGRELFPDLKQFRRPRHRAILYDEGTPEMVLKHKLVFQSSNAWCTLGNSPCNRDVYHRWFYGTHQIICSNTWEADLLRITSWEDYEWLQDNSIVIPVDHGTFFEA